MGWWLRVVVNDVNIAKKELLASIIRAGLTLTRYEIVRPSLEEVFLHLVGQEGGRTMSVFVALRKEFMELSRTYRLLVVVAVLVFFGLISPLSAKFMRDSIGPYPWWGRYSKSDPATNGLGCNCTICQEHASVWYYPGFAGYHGRRCRRER